MPSRVTHAAATSRAGYLLPCRGSVSEWKWESSYFWLAASTAWASALTNVYTLTLLSARSICFSLSQISSHGRGETKHTKEDLTMRQRGGRPDCLSLFFVPPPHTQPVTSKTHLCVTLASRDVAIFLAKGRPSFDVTRRTRRSGNVSESERSQRERSRRPRPYRRLFVATRSSSQTTSHG